MRLVSFLGSSTAVAFAAAVVFAQPSTGALPPVSEPAPSAPPTASAPPAPSPAPAPSIAPPAPAQPSAPPGYAYPPPAYGAPPPAYGYGYGYPAPVAPPPEPPPPHRSVSLTISPLHLILPVFEATAEVRPVDHLGIAVIGGYGSVPISYSNGNSDSLTAYEIGGQVVAYPWNDFYGPEFGVEALYVHLSGNNLDQGNITGVGEGFAIGPMGGYKLVTSGGFTFVAQGGVEYVALRAEANDTSGNSAQKSDSRFIPLLNLNVGWSL